MKRLPSLRARRDTGLSDTVSRPEVIGRVSLRAASARRKMSLCVRRAHRLRATAERRSCLPRCLPRPSRLPRSAAGPQDGFSLTETVWAMALYAAGILLLLHAWQRILHTEQQQREQAQAWSIAWQTLIRWPDSDPMPLPTGWQRTITIRQQGARCQRHTVRLSAAHGTTVQLSRLFCDAVALTSALNADAD